MRPAPSTLDLAEAVERNFVDSWLLLARLDPETELIDVDGIRGFISGSRSPLLNGIVETRIPADRSTDAVIDGILDRFGERDLPATWWILPSAEPADLRQRLSARGLVYAGSMPGMAIDVGAARDIVAPAGANRAGGLTIEPVQSDNALAAFLSVAIPALDAPDDFGTIFARTIIAQGFGTDCTIRNYLGRLDGMPVATSTLIVGGGIAGIYNVATEASHRGRGFGAAMTLAALDDARRHGVRIAVLQSTELGHPLYEALGFRDVCTIHLHVLDAPGWTAP
jgi:ribosomal protein S18 acetylase RimI-like enzyme